MTSLANKYDFVFFFDVQDGNPNGDPDAGNLPRIDPETGHGITTDVCLKRKLRNYVLTAQPGAKGYDIFVKERAILNNLIDEAHEQPEVKKKEKREKTDAAREYVPPILRRSYLRRGHVNRQERRSGARAGPAHVLPLD
jgi:CRISPR-associated protein Csd2